MQQMNKDQDLHPQTFREQSLSALRAKTPAFAAYFSKTLLISCRLKEAG